MPLLVVNQSLGQCKVWNDTKAR